MPRACTVCADSKMARRMTEMVVAGETDLAIAAELQLGRMAVWRHRRQCIEGPAQLLAERANKGRTVVEERKKLVKRAEAGELDVSDYLGLASITHDLKAVGARLERVADAAEVDGQRGAVAQLAGQQIRQNEVRARLGGHGGFAPQKGGAADIQPFIVSINFAGQPSERIEVSGGPTIEGEARSPQTDGAPLDTADERDEPDAFDSGSADE